MGTLTGNEIIVGLLSLAVILGSAKILGEAFNRIKLPSLIGEIFAGILIGPTLLGRINPEFAQWLFPTGARIYVSIDMLALLGVILLLLVAGLEVDLSSVLKQGRSVMIFSLFSIAIPFSLGILLGYLFPELFGSADNRLAIMLFVGTALSITALPVIAKILMDLKLFQSDFGMLILSIAMINDLLGWIVFSVVIQVIHTGAVQPLMVAQTIGLTLAFSAAVLVVFRGIVHQTLPWIQAHTSYPGGVIAFVVVSGLFLSSLAEAIGMHAIFGAFMAGIAIGDTPHLREKTREIIDKFVNNIFSPLFFASIGMRIDFIRNFNPLLTLIIVGVVIAGKFAAAFAAGSLNRVDMKIRMSIGSGTIASGAMGIILGLVALQYGIINEDAFESIVIMAVVTTVLSAPLLKMFLKKEKTLNILDLIDRRGFIQDMKAITLRDAIRELADTASVKTGLQSDRIFYKVLEREMLMSTGMGFNIAFPHARLPEIDKPHLVVGISNTGIDFNAPDGLPAHLVFLILTPLSDQNMQIQILSELSNVFLNEKVRTETMNADSFIHFIAAIKSQYTG